MAGEKRWEVVNDEGDKYHEESARRHNTAQSLRWIAEQLDSRFHIFGVRVGWDPIIGLIPGFGDLATNLASFYIMIQASNLGAPPSVILRMGLNLVIDNLVDTIPLLGSLFDVFWRANTRNVELFERYLENPRRTTVGSRWVVLLTLAGVLIVSLVCVALALFVVVLIIRLVSGAAQSW